MKITRRQLRQIIREETSGVENPNKTADSFGGGTVEEEIFIDVDDSLLNVNSEEASVKDTGMAGSPVSPKDAMPTRESRRRRLKSIIRSVIREVTQKR